MNYGAKIIESTEFLLEQEHKSTLAIIRDRVRFIRLLKSGEARTQSAAGKVIGLCERQSQRLWRIYQQEGLASLQKKPSWGYWGKLSSVQIAHLRQFLLDDQAETLADIQAYLQQNLGVSYTIGGISDLCKRLKIKLKTGRPVNVRQKEGAVEDFKKSLAN
jgi:transposase